MIYCKSLEKIELKDKLHTFNETCLQKRRHI